MFIHADADDLVDPIFLGGIQGIVFIGEKSARISH